MSDDPSDDDWFERAVSDDAADPDADDGDEDADDAHDDPEPEIDLGDDSGDDGVVDDRSDDDGDAPTDPEDAAEAAFAAAESAVGSGSDDDQSGGASLGDGSSTDLFDDGSGSDPFGGGGADAGGSGAGSSLFDDDFESAFESAGGPGDEFDDEELDSAIPRIDLGITGLDAMIHGGIPERHLVVTIGSAGTGKTTFGLQFLNHGLENGENAVFITLEQSHDAIIDTAEERDWEFERYEEEDRLAVVDLDPVEMANSLDNIRAELPDLIEKFDADRLVLDSVSLLEMMYDDQARRRTEVFDFTRSLKEAGVTTMLTSEANEDNPYASRHGIIEYLTDAVFVLQYVRSETRETRLAVEIQKIRNANHSRETKPYEITLEGISVYQQANIF